MPRPAQVPSSSAWQRGAYPSGELALRLANRYFSDYRDLETLSTRRYNATFFPIRLGLLVPKSMYELVVGAV